METIQWLFYDFRLRLANFISGGELRQYAGLYSAHSTYRQISQSIASEALQCETIEEAREQYYREIQKSQEELFKRIDKILKD